TSGCAAGARRRPGSMAARCWRCSRRPARATSSSSAGARAASPRSATSATCRTSPTRRCSCWQPRPARTSPVCAGAICIAEGLRSAPRRRGLSSLPIGPASRATKESTMNVVGLSGSPSAQSRSAWLLQFAQTRLNAQRRGEAATITLRELPAQALVHGDAQHPVLREAIGRIARADVLLVATPIYKAAYSGLLKVFLDLLPSDILRGKSVLPLATGGSPGHLLAIDYALKPVFGALGESHIVSAILSHGTQTVPHE